MQRLKRIVGWAGRTFGLMSGVILLLWLSGCLMYGLPAEALADMSPAQAFTRRTSVIVHGVSSWLFCIMLGRSVWPHVRVMWHRDAIQSAWLWGLVSASWLGFLAVGGLLLLYASPSLHEALSPWHFWVGLLGMGGYWVHTWARWRAWLRPRSAQT